MHYDYITVQPNDWIDALARFQNFINRGVYNKIDYRIWKQLSKLDPFKTNLLIGWHYNQASSRFDITVMTEDMELTFNSKDGSFGEYLNIWVLSTIDKNTCSEIPKTFNITTNTDNTEKENNIMKFNFDFGPVNPSLVRMSMYGLAVKNKSGTWVSYNSNSDEIMDVDVLNFDGAKFLYRAPVAIKDIAVGDVVIHNGAPMFVVAIPDDGRVLTVIDTINGERKDIMLAKSPFGFNFATKVVNFLGNMFNASATTENPFGNMWMLMAMSGDNKDMDDMLPFLMMNNAASGMDNNMLMCMLLCKNKGNSNLLPWVLMSRSMNAAPAHECKCGGNCGNHQPQN